MKRFLIIALLLMLSSASFAVGYRFDERGPRAALTNPAFLGLQTRHDFAIEIPGADAIVSNNSFSVRFWNEHIAGDEYWDGEDVQTILARIPETGLRMSAAATAPMIGFRYRNVAINAELIGIGRAAVPKDVAEMVLVGTKLNEAYSLGMLAGESVAVSDYSLAFGWKLSQDRHGSITMGAAVHYYQGLVMTQVDEFSGDLLVTENSITGEGMFRYATGTYGNGFGADVGLMAQVSEKWQFGFAAKQIGARLVWEKTDITEEYFETDVEGIYIDSLEEEGYSERILASESHTYEGGVTTTTLPRVLQATAVYSASAHWCFAGFVGTYGGSELVEESKEMGLDIMYVPARWTFLRGGASTGGLHRTMFSFGTGLRFGNYELDISVASTGGLFKSAQGAGLEISQRLFF